MAENMAENIAENIDVSNDLNISQNISQSTAVEKPPQIIYMEQYIKALVENVDDKSIPNTINVVFDGGALNGFYAIGISMYLRELQKKHVKIDKVSGCSAGTLVAIYFLSGNFDNCEIGFKKMVDCFRNNQNAQVWTEIVREAIFYLFKNDTTSLEPLQNRLYISYYDVVEKKQCVVHNYTSREELIDYVIRSSFIPYLINGERRYKDKYIDGITPYLFNTVDENPSLFVQLICGKRISRTLMTKTEVNPHHRIMSGVADANDFFTTGNSEMCSYLHNWSKIDKIIFHGKAALIFFIFTMFECMVRCRRLVPDVFTDNLIYQGMARFIIEMYRTAFQSLFM